MSKRRKELYRIPSQGRIAGVCAGVADYFGWETWLVRILVVSGVLLGGGWLIVIYIAGWFILDKKDVDGLSTNFTPNKAKHHQVSEEDIANESIKVKAKIWQSGEPPRQAFRDIKRKYQVLEQQLQSIERYVTSAEFTVSREISKL